MFFKTRFRTEVKATVKATIITVLLFIGLAGFCGLRALGGPRPPASQADLAQEAWRKELFDVCAKTQDAMTFSPAEVRDLVRRCDSLRPQIEKTEKLDETGKKVYLERLRKCRDFYAYMLDAKKEDAKSEKKK